MKVTILGCGGSGGVPLADGTSGGNWGACNPEVSKNRRRRVSILVEQGATTLLLDTSPDLREQLLSVGVPDIDAVLFTHGHADHCHGLDDLRPLVYKRGGPLDAYMDEETRDILIRKFGYAFASSYTPDDLYRPLLRDLPIDGPIDIDGITVTPFAQGHGPVTSVGYRLDNIAYSTDVKSLDEAAFAVLDGVDLWIVDCLRDKPHPTHAHVALALEWIERIKPARAVLTHMNHQIDYEDLKSRCPAGVEPAYDGMVLQI